MGRSAILVIGHFLIWIESWWREWEWGSWWVCSKFYYQINQNFEGEVQLDEDFAEPTKSKWKRPQPPYHVTSLFVNRKKEHLEKEEYKQFKEGILERIMIKGYIIVENSIMIAMLFPQSTIIENIVIIFIC